MPRQIINGSAEWIPEEQRWKYVDMNVSSPSTRGLIKLYKEGEPIMLIVNCRNTPFHNLAKFPAF
jgi:hypothetical protein